MATINAHGANKRASTDASQALIEPTRNLSSVQAAEAAIAAAVHRRRSSISALIPKPHPSKRHEHNVIVPQLPLTRFPAHRTSERCGAAVGKTGSDLNSGGPEDGAEWRDPCGKGMEELSAAAVPVDNGDVEAAIAADRKPHTDGADVSTGKAHELHSGESPSPVAATNTYLRFTTFCAGNTNDISLDMPWRPDPDSRPASGPAPEVLMELHLSCGPELQTMDMAGIMTTAAACLQANWSALSASSSVGEASMECIWTGDCSSAAHVISALPSQRRRRRRHHQQQQQGLPLQRDDDPHMGSFGDLTNAGRHGGGGAQVAAGGDDADMGPTKRSEVSGGGNKLVTGGSNNCCRAAVGRYGTLMMSSAGWRCTEMYDMHDSLLLSRLSTLRGAFGANGTGGGGDEGNPTGNGNMVRMGLAWAAGSASVHGTSKRQDSDLKAVDEAAGEMLAMEETAGTADTVQCSRAGHSSGRSGNLGEAANRNEAPKHVTDFNRRSLTEFTQIRHRILGGVLHSPQRRPHHQQQQQPQSQPLPQPLPFPLQQLPLQHRLAAINAAGIGGSGRGSWGAALESLLEKVAPRTSYCSPPGTVAVSMAGLAATGGPGSSSYRASVSGYGSSAGGHLLERSGRGRVVTSIRRWAGQIKARVSGTGVLAICDTTYLDRFSRFSPSSTRTSPPAAAAMAAVSIGNGGPGGGDSRGLLSTGSLHYQEPAYCGGGHPSYGGSTISAPLTAGAASPVVLPPLDVASQHPSTNLARRTSPAQPPGHTGIECYVDGGDVAVAAAPAASASGPGPGSGSGSGLEFGYIARSVEDSRRQPSKRSSHLASLGAPAAATTTVTTPKAAVSVVSHYESNCVSPVCKQQKSRSSPGGVLGPVAALAAGAAAMTTTTGLEDGYGGGVLMMGPSALSTGEAEGVEDDGVGGVDTAQSPSKYHRASSCASRGYIVTDDGDKVAKARNAAAGTAPLPYKQMSSSTVNEAGNTGSLSTGGFAWCGLSCLLSIPRKKSSNSSKAVLSNTREFVPLSGPSRNGVAAPAGAAVTCSSSSVTRTNAQHDRLARIAPLAAAVFSS